MLTFIAVAVLSSPPAAACGGLFCDAATMEPVDQKAERILFEVGPDGTITTFVEISYVGRADQFAWVLPIPHAIAADDVQTWDAAMFDALEALTAPRFSFFDSSARPSRGLGCAAEFELATSDSDEGVEVVDQFTVGPYALQVLAGDDGAALQRWLTDNGYDLPDSAVSPLQHYVDAGMAFLGVKLIAEEVDEGPLDTLSFTYHAGAPMIPLILTGIAAVPDMPIVTYIVADEPMRVAGGYVAVDFDWQSVRPDGGRYPTTYVPLLQAQIDDLGGHAFVLEYADSTDQVRPTLPEPAVLPSGRWIGRFRTYLSPEEMTVDPVWVRDPSGPEVVSNVHQVDTATDPARSEAPWAMAALLALGLRRRRRRRG